LLNSITLSDSAKQLKDLAFNTKYYWRIKATGNKGSSNWSNVRSFSTVAGFPEIIQLNVPANSAKNTAVNPKLVWASSVNSEQYQLQVSENETFTKVIINDSLLILSASGKELTALKTGMKYYWRVRGINPAGPGNFSSVWNFTTLIPPCDSLLHKIMV
jgi:peptidoglycan hydrolase-like protein with peptidoglycan-binding domain